MCRFLSNPLVSGTKNGGPFLRVFFLFSPRGNNFNNYENQICSKYVTRYVNSTTVYYVMRYVNSTTVYYVPRYVNSTTVYYGHNFKNEYGILPFFNVFFLRFLVELAQRLSGVFRTRLMPR